MSTLDPVRFLAKNMRVDLALIAGMIAPNTRVLDIGCGDGMLIDHLFQTKGCDARGIEIDMAEVTRAVAHGLPVMQAVEKPRAVLQQMLRIGTRAVVSFPNFGHWLVRWQLLSTGRMPMTATWDRPWHETPNIHPCTIRDFFVLCEEEGYVVESWLATDDGGRRAPWRRAARLANMFGEQGLFLLRHR
jgi:SAM-dependent methyltransferase